MSVIPAGSNISNNLLGLTVKLDRPVERERPCCSNICIIEAARAPHAGELVCVGCNRRRGWLSKTTAAWIEKVIAHFGAPTTPIVLRKLHMFESDQNRHRRRRTNVANQ